MAKSETRQRIVEATRALHEAVGPAATTITGIAERAGVQRLTVYRHFPDERALIGACSADWSADHPLPDPASWAGVADAKSRLRAALEASAGDGNASRQATLLTRFELGPDVDWSSGRKTGQARVWSHNLTRDRLRRPTRAGVPPCHLAASPQAWCSRS